MGVDTIMEQVVAEDYVGPDESLIGAFTLGIGISGSLGRRLSIIHRRFIAALFTGEECQDHKEGLGRNCLIDLPIVTLFVTLGRRLGCRFQGKGGDVVMRRIIGLIVIVILVYAAARGICRIWPKLCGK
jgi:hypothetical protein